MVPCLLFAAGRVLLLAGPAFAQGSDPGRMVAAPRNLDAVWGYALQPPSGDEGGGREDSLSQREPKPTQQQQPPGGALLPPGGASFPDSAKKTSTFGNPMGDTLTARFMGEHHAQETGPPPPGARRGILGIHPIAILVGLIALDVFVVTVAGK